MPDQDERRAELAASLARVRRRIADACAAVGRPRDEVTLVAVTKTYPATDVLHLAGLGVGDVGENRDQEAAPKAAQVRAAGTEVRWHFVGQLQRNKARSVATYADLVHSVDSVRLAGALAEAAARHRESPLDVLVQVSIDGDPARGGARLGGPPDTDLDQVAEAIAVTQSLRLRGVMTVAPVDWDPGAAFERLAGIADRMRVNYPTATVVSAGMSADVESAVEYGATHVRIGSALLGNRASLR
ncbi:YggS family pyridoxal phosphate-dependent enzyme [Rugosimonospora acidiphila]|uniref:Pyridoxal phosphate homeostasis protein n=1 Tax=Rugosimonospora acidiphila TaxID=556531 RepID=A0ABP9SJB7_9ACTN